MAFPPLAASPDTVAGLSQQNMQDPTVTAFRAVRSANLEDMPYDRPKSSQGHWTSAILKSQDNHQDHFTRFPSSSSSPRAATASKRPSSPAQQKRSSSLEARRAEAYYKHLERFQIKRTESWVDMRQSRPQTRPPTILKPLKLLRPPNKASKPKWVYGNPWSLHGDSKSSQTREDPEHAEIDTTELEVVARLRNDDKKGNNISKMSWQSLSNGSSTSSVQGKNRLLGPNRVHPLNPLPSMSARKSILKTRGSRDCRPDEWDKQDADVPLFQRSFPSSEVPAVTSKSFYKNKEVDVMTFYHDQVKDDFAKDLDEGEGKAVLLLSGRKSILTSRRRQDADAPPRVDLPSTTLSETFSDNRMAEVVTAQHDKERPGRQMYSFPTLSARKSVLRARGTRECHDDEKENSELGAEGGFRTSEGVPASTTTSVRDEVQVQVMTLHHDQFQETETSDVPSDEKDMTLEEACDVLEDVFADYLVKTDQEGAEKYLQDKSSDKISQGHGKTGTKEKRSKRRMVRTNTSKRGQVPVQTTQTSPSRKKALTVKGAKPRVVLPKSRSRQLDTDVTQALAAESEIPAGVDKSKLKEVHKVEPSSRTQDDKKRRSRHRSSGASMHRHRSGRQKSKDDSEDAQKVDKVPREGFVQDHFKKVSVPKALFTDFSENIASDILEGALAVYRYLAAKGELRSKKSALDAIIEESVEGLEEKEFDTAVDELVSTILEREIQKSAQEASFEFSLTPRIDFVEQAVHVVDDGGEQLIDAPVGRNDDSNESVTGVVVFGADPTKLLPQRGTAKRRPLSFMEKRQILNAHRKRRGAT